MIILASNVKVVFDRLPIQNKKRMAFITNAMDKHIDKSSLEKNKLFLENKGFDVKEIDLKLYSKEELEKELSGFEIIFVLGGNCFLLLEIMISSGFIDILDNLLNKEIIYLGQSAGAVVMGSSVEPIKSMDNHQVANLKNFKGLNYLNFVFVPHYKNERFNSKIEELVRKYSSKFKLKLFTDNEGIIMNKGILKNI